MGELGYESSIAEALLGTDAVTGGVHGGTEDDAARWEARTLGIDNVNVYAIVAAGLGINLDGHDGRVMADGFPPPIVDGAVDEELANVLFRDGVGVRAKPNSPALVPDEDEEKRTKRTRRRRLTRRLRRSASSPCCSSPAPASRWYDGICATGRRTPRT